MKKGEPANGKELHATPWNQEGVVYARVYRNHVVYVGKKDGLLSDRILRHVNGISKAMAGKAREYREWAEGKTITILACRPEPVRRFGLQQVAQTAVVAVCGFWGAVDQIRVRGSEGILRRSMIKPQRRFCSSALMPAYSLKLNHVQSCGWRTRPARNGFM